MCSFIGGPLHVTSLQVFDKFSILSMKKKLLLLLFKHMVFGLGQNDESKQLKFGVLCSIIRKLDVKVSIRRNGRLLITIFSYFPVSQKNCSCG